jgi:hypothetical protein
MTHPAKSTRQGTPPPLQPPGNVGVAAGVDI